MEVRPGNHHRRQHHPGRPGGEGLPSRQARFRRRVDSRLSPGPHQRSMARASKPAEAQPRRQWKTWRRRCPPRKVPSNSSRRIAPARNSRRRPGQSAMPSSIPCRRRRPKPGRPAGSRRGKVVAAPPWRKASSGSGRSRRPSATMGIPSPPNATGVVLAIRARVTAWRAVKPKPSSRKPATATGEPKPDVPSSKAPKQNATRMA